MPFYTPTQCVTPGTNLYGLNNSKNRYRQLTNGYLYACDLIDICLDAVRKTFEQPSDSWIFPEERMPGKSQQLQYEPKYDFIVEELVQNNPDLEHSLAYKHIIRDHLARNIIDDSYLSNIESGDIKELLTTNPNEIDNEELRKRVIKIQGKYKRTKELYNIWMIQLDPLFAEEEFETIIDITASVTNMDEPEKEYILSGNNDISYLSRERRLLDFFQKYFKIQNRLVLGFLNALKEEIENENIWFNGIVVKMLMRIIASQDEDKPLTSTTDYYEMRKNVINILNRDLIKDMESSIITQGKLRSQGKYPSYIYDELLRVDIYTSISSRIDFQYHWSTYELDEFRFMVIVILNILASPPRCTDFWSDEKQKEIESLAFPEPILQSFTPSTPIYVMNLIKFATYYSELTFEDNEKTEGNFCEPVASGGEGLHDVKTLQSLIESIKRDKEQHMESTFDIEELKRSLKHYKNLEQATSIINELPQNNAAPYIANEAIKELAEYELKTVLENSLQVPENHTDINVGTVLKFGTILSHIDPTRISLNDAELLEYQIRIELCRLCSSNSIPFSYVKEKKKCNYHIGSESFYLTRTQAQTLLSELSMSQQVVADPIHKMKKSNLNTNDSC